MEKYRQIVTEIEAKINKGELPIGSKLPALRELAITFGSSKATVARGMTELSNRGVIYAKNRSGYYVLGKSKEQPITIGQVVDFSSKGVDWRTFPSADFQRCLMTAMEQQQAELFYYGQPKGVPSLASSLVDLLADFGVYTKEEAIYISSGIQEALYILSQLEFPNGGQRILVENPTYDTFLRTLTLLGKPVSAVERTLKGLDLEGVEAAFKTGQIKFFYTMSRLHNPLGTSLKKAEMLQLLALAETYDVYLVEDDYLADYHQGKKNLPLHYYDTKQRVIYLKSFSKIVFPGIRVGAIVLPKLLRETFTRYKASVNISTDSLSQIAMATYIDSGMYEKNRKDLTAKLAQRAQVLRKSFDLYLADFDYPKDSLLHLSLAFPKGVNKQTFLAELGEESIYVDGLEGSFLNSPKNHLIKLNVTTVHEKDIEAGVRSLANHLRRHVERL